MYIVGVLRLMTEAEQAAVYLRLRREFTAIRNEMASIRAELTRLGRAFAELGKGVAEDPLKQSLDQGVLQGEIAKLCDVLERYKQLVVQKVDKEAELARFLEPFPSVESVQ